MIPQENSSDEKKVTGQTGHVELSFEYHENGILKSISPEKE